jgi:beta-xylosidase
LAGEGFYNGRLAILQEMIMDEDGWIKCATGTIARITQPIPFDKTEQQPVAGFTDDFKNAKPSISWSWNFVYSDAEVKTGNGVLQLSGKPKEGNDFGTAFCIRPLKPDYVYETKVNNVNASLKGLTMYGDHKNLVALGVAGNKLILKEIRNGQETVISEKELQATTPYLRIEVVKGCYCSFSYSEDGKDWKEIEIDPSPKDYRYLVRWDRVARPGLIHIGLSDEPAEFTAFSMNLK